MLGISFNPFIWLFSVILWGPNTAPVEPVVPNDQYKEKVILVQLDVRSPKDVDFCYSKKFDRKKVELIVSYDDTLIYLPDFIFEEDALESPNCFYPEMKIIFKTYTYIVSLYCTKVVKYKNAAPFSPSNRKIENDLEITETVLDYLRYKQLQHFGSHSNKKIADSFVKNEPLVDVKIADGDLNLEEDENDGIDIENDAIDDKGWFEEIDFDEEFDLIKNDDDVD